MMPQSFPSVESSFSIAASSSSVELDSFSALFRAAAFRYNAVNLSVCVGLNSASCLGQKHCKKGQKGFILLAIRICVDALGQDKTVEILLSRNEDVRVHSSIGNTKGPEQPNAGSDSEPARKLFGESKGGGKGGSLKQFHPARWPEDQRNKQKHSKYKMHSTCPLIV